MMSSCMRVDMRCFRLLLSFLQEPRVSGVGLFLRWLGDIADLLPTGSARLRVVGESGPAVRTVVNFSCN